MDFILNTKLVHYYIKRYCDLPKNAKILKVHKNFVDFEVGEERKCRVYGREFQNLPVFQNIQKLLWGFLFILSKPVAGIGFLFFGTTDTTSTVTKVTWVDSANPTTNYGTSNQINLDARTSPKRWGLIGFTTPNLSGTISDVKLYLYSNGPASTTTKTVEVNQLTRSNWTEAGATWNKYDGTTDWTTAGGDYSATVVDKHTPNASAGWENWVLMGTGADNAMTITWNTSYDLRVAYSVQDATYEACGYDSDDGTNKPYVEITYTAVTNVTVSATVLSSTFTIPAYTVTAIQNVTVSPTALSATFSIPTYSSTVDVSVSPTTQSATFSIPTYVVTINDIVVLVSTQVCTFSIPTYTPSGIRNIDVTPSVQVLTFTIPAHTVTVEANITISASVLSAIFTIPSYTVLGDYWENKHTTPATSWSDKNSVPATSWNNKY